MSITLDELRKSLNISQAGIAKRLNRSAAAIHKAERSSDPLVSTIVLYIDALGQELDCAATVDVVVTLGGRQWTLAFAPSPERIRGESLTGGCTLSQAERRDLPTSSANSVLDRLDVRVVQHARSAVEDLVVRTQASGRRGIEVGHEDTLGSLFTAVAREFGRPAPGGVFFGGRAGEPGLWHALQALYAIDDTNRWNELRRAVVANLIASGRWRRRGASPRGAEFFVSDD